MRKKKPVGVSLHATDRQKSFEAGLPHGPDTGDEMVPVAACERKTLSLAS
jgi:hypothetical protein